MFGREPPRDPAGRQRVRHDVLFVYAEGPCCTPPTGTIPIAGLGGDRVMPIPFGIYAPPRNGVTRLRSWPIPISPFKKGSATVILNHGETFTTTYSRTVGT